MIVAGIICLFLSTAFMYFYFTLPALTTAKENDLRVKLSTVDIVGLFERQETLSMEAFSHLVDEDLTDSEVIHVFHVIDKNKNGVISKNELIDYITNDGSIDIVELQNERKDMQERREQMADADTRVGTAAMKFRILLSYVQIMSFLPVVFELPFPRMMTNFMKLLEFSSLDIYVFFGEVSCQMQTTFKQKFVFHMMLIPVICLCIGIVWGIIRLRVKHGGRPRFTRESVKTRVYTFISQLTFGLYAGVSTKIFRLFKCREVQGRYYLVADFSVECYVGTWWNYGGVAILCIILYVVGVPMMQLFALLRNREHLHETSALDHQSHRLVKRQLGTLYDRYTDESFYFEIVNMLRRLMMTGGLILVGERSVVQALLGILTSLIWLLLVATKFPYKAYWDNLLEIALSFSLLMSLISGFALELFGTKETSGYEQAIFDILLVLMIVGCICAGVFAIVITLPLCHTRLVALLSKCKKKNARDVLDQWTVQRHSTMKWLSTTDAQEVLDAARTSLESRANANFQASLKKKRMHKIYPSWMTKRLNTSVKGLARTKLLAKERKKIRMSTTSRHENEFI